ncbi:unnamed protein product [Bursaphelenchus xylophilus]|uniref:(pine wood nematode) hypothetical protein n=1 Tax=Bursaphelenchus xylophilus TaxID=6326 RepID=A0A1I7RTF0_BURXY|nr:unnamed protein product [Bursaphelenchus xylophilus]CAG9122478.1 unnamed protein product [Bursaphelenchus xylophilus]
MEEPNLYDSEDSEDQPKIDIREGISLTITHTDDPDREPFVIVEHQSLNIESTGKLDKTKLYVSDKEIDAVIYTKERDEQTTNCSKQEVGTQHEHQTLSMEQLQRVLASQKFERFLNTIVPMMEEEVRQNVILEKILW